jgi:hypothetical protein
MSRTIEAVAQPTAPTHKPRPARRGETIFCAQWQIGLETFSGFAQRKLRLQFARLQPLPIAHSNK